MSDATPITLTDDLMAQVQAVAREDGIPPNAVLRAAVKAYVFRRRVDQLRGKMMKELADRGIHLTDEDVFEMIS